MQLALEDRYTYASDDLWLSEFRLLPNHPAWHLARQTTEAASLLAFPRMSVAIRHEGRREVVADPMSAVAYSPGQPYRRRLVSASGDDCTVVAVSSELLAQVVNNLDSRSDRRDYRFPFVAASVDRIGHMTLQRIRQMSAENRAANGDAIREELYVLVQNFVAAGYRESGVDVGPHRSRAWLELADAVREELSRDVAQRLGLDDLARKLAVSPFHLVRIFRSITGKPIHAYRTELRLRSSLPLISDGVRLADIALQVGFSSHAHLTDHFVRAYGVTPSQWREMSKNLIAPA